MPTEITLSSETLAFYDPLEYKFKELEERINKLENRFEIVDVTKEENNGN